MILKAEVPSFNNINIQICENPAQLRVLVWIQNITIQLKVKYKSVRTIHLIKYIIYNSEGTFGKK